MYSVISVNAQKEYVKKLKPMESFHQIHLYINTELKPYQVAMLIQKCILLCQLHWHLVHTCKLIAKDIMERIAILILLQLLRTPCFLGCQSPIMAHQVTKLHTFVPVSQCI